MKAARLFLVLCAALGLCHSRTGHGIAAGRAGGSPGIVYSAPAELQATADALARIPPSRLQTIAELVGVNGPSPSVEVEIVPESSPLARGAPSWVAGYAVPPESRIVLFPARSPGYPDGNLENVLLHELAHVLIFRAANGHPVPRWFHEGLAMFAARERTVEDRARLLFEVVFKEPPPLQKLDEGFFGEPGDVRRAYAVSGAFFRYLVERQGAGIAARVLRETAGGIGFDEAFRRGTGDAAIFSYFDFWHGLRAPDVWIPVLTSTTVLWFAITVLAIIAMRKRRKRFALQRKAWEEEEKARKERLTLEVLEEYEDDRPPN